VDSGLIPGIDTGVSADGSVCGLPGDPGNEKGVGKFCTDINNCSGLEADICTSIENSPSNPLNTFFCTIVGCQTKDAGFCGSGAACACMTNGCGCTPIQCVSRLVPDAGAADSGMNMNDAGTSTLATTFHAHLSGLQEVPTTTSAATGSATVTVSGLMLHYDITHNVVNGTASHIHKADPGQEGPVVFPIPNFSTHMTGDLTATADQIKDLRAGHYYINVHSVWKPNGEIRGQLTSP
jgi:hypothetical protein